MYPDLQKGLAATAMLLLILAAPATPAAVGEAADELHFRVLLDDRKIGEHRFTITPEAGGTRVRSEAQFDVRLLGIPVYRYRHENTEQWGEDGCLRAISSRTTANRDSFLVDGQRDDERFRVETATGELEFDATCVMSFAYWDRTFLQASRLLNSQTGEYLDVRVEPLAAQEWSRNGAGIIADGYRIIADGSDATDPTDIRVWYAREDGRWLGLESRVANGRLLAYVRADEDA